MSGPTAVVDANTIIGLAKGGVFDLLARLLGAVHVPAQVTNEIVVQG